MIQVTVLERGEVRTVEVEESALTAFRETLEGKGGSILGTARVRQAIKLRIFAKGPEAWASWFSALARTLKGGVPLDQSLELLATAAPAPELAQQVHQDVVAGRRFSEAVNQRLRELPMLVSALLRAGEAAGDLGRGASLAHSALVDIATFRRELTARLAYPLIVVSASSIALCVLLLKVFPAMQGMWSTLNKPLPPSIAAIRVFGWVGVLVLLALALGFGWLMGGSEKAQRLPGFRNLGRHRHRGEAWSALAMALGGGVSLLEALSLFGDQWGAGRIKEGIQRGVRPEVALEAWVDDAPGQRAVLMASLRIGDLAGGAQSVAEGYRELLDQDLRSLQRWLEPAVLVLLGTILMGLAWSLFSLLGQMEHGLVR